LVPKTFKENKGIQIPIIFERISSEATAIEIASVTCICVYLCFVYFFLWCLFLHTNVLQPIPLTKTIPHPKFILLKAIAIM